MGNKIRTALHTTLLYEKCQIALKKKKKQQDTQIANQEIKLSLFADEIIVYVEYLK